MSEEIIVEQVSDKNVTSDEIRDIIDILSDAFKFDVDPTIGCYAVRCQISHMINEWTHIYVIKKDGKIIGVGTLLIERKLIRNLSLAAHIEDVAIHKDYRGFGYGKRLIEHIKAKAKAYGCYKVVLFCADYNKKFYQKCGFRFTSCGMRAEI